MGSRPSLRRPCPTLRSLFDRAQFQSGYDLQSAFSCEPDNIRWPYAACTAGIPHARISDVCACGSWPLELVLRQAEHQPSLACFGLLQTDTMHDCLRRFSRKVIVGLAQALTDVFGKPAIFA